MPKAILRGAFVRFIDVRYDESSKMLYTKINMTADFSDTVRELMEWGELPAGYGSANLDGEFHVTHFVLTPNGRQLKDNEIQIDARELGSFTFHRVKAGEDSTTQELRFQMVTTDPNAPALVAAYLSVIGKSPAQLRVNYEQQADLPLGEAEEPEEAKLISDEQAAETAEEPIGGGTLAPMPRTRKPRNVQ